MTNTVKELCEWAELMVNISSLSKKTLVSPKMLLYRRWTKCLWLYNINNAITFVLNIYFEPTFHHVILTQFKQHLMFSNSMKRFKTKTEILFQTTICKYIFVTSQEQFILNDFTLFLWLHFYSWTIWAVKSVVLFESLTVFNNIKLSLQKMFFHNMPHR